MLKELKEPHARGPIDVHCGSDDNDFIRETSADGVRRRRMGMRYRKYFVVAALTLACAVWAYAADATGAWKASFATQIGGQHYTYDLKADKDQLTGKATNGPGLNRHYRRYGQGR